MVTLALILVAAGCGGSEDTSAAQPIPADRGLEFGNQELYFLQLEGGASLWRFDERAEQTVRVPLGPAAEGRAGIAISADSMAQHLYALTADRSGPVRVDRLTAEGLEPVVEVDQAMCIAEDRVGDDVQVTVQADDDFEPRVGVLADVVSIDATTGATSIEQFSGRHLFCPAWSGDGSLVAYGGPREGDPEFTVALFVESGGDTQNLRWDACALNPQDFNSDGSLLAVGATCEDEPSKSGLYVFDPTDLTQPPELLRRGTTAAASWSPDDCWIAYTYLAPEDRREFELVQVEIMEVATRQYTSVQFLNTSWPAWIIPEATERS